MKKLLDTLLLWALTLPLVIGGGYAVYHGNQEEYLARKSTSWPSTIGRVTSSYVHITRGKSTNYWPVVEYQYTLNNATFENDQINFGQVSSRRDDADAAMARYPVGKMVPVYYYPEAPAVSCLEPGYRPISALMPILGFLGCLLGTTVLGAQLILFLARPRKKLRR